MLEEEVPSKWQRYSNVIASDPSLSLSPAFLPLSLSVTRLREEEGERGGTPRFSEGKNNARYSWGNHLASNLFCCLSLSFSLPTQLTYARMAYGLCRLRTI